MRRLRRVAGPALRWASPKKREWSEYAQRRLTSAQQYAIRAIGERLSTRPQILLPVIRILQLIGPSETLLRADGILTARASSWNRATQRMESRKPGIEARSLNQYWTAILGYPRDLAPMPTVIPTSRAEGEIPKEVAGKIAVYTVCFGSTGPPPAIQLDHKGIRFFCLTDHDLIARGWEVVRVDQYRENCFDRERCVIAPHDVLRKLNPACEWSLYLAPDTLFGGNLSTLIGRWLLHVDCVAMRHPAAEDWWQLAEHEVLRERSDPLCAARWAAEIEESGVARNSGAWTTRLLWRRHASDEVAALTERWLAASRSSCASDDATLTQAIVCGGPTIAVLPRSLGTATSSAYTLAAHGTPETSPRFSGSHLSARDLRPVTGRTRLKISFVYPSGTTEHEATTVLRGVQLSKLLNERHSDLFDICLIDEQADLHDRVLIVLRNTLTRLDASRLEELRSRNIAVVNVWDDRRPDEPRMRAVDAQMVVSIRQMGELNRSYPGVRAFFVTHHVNLDFPAGHPLDDVLRVGYFGAPFNTRVPSTLSDTVTLIDTPFRGGDDSWMQRFLEFNCHWTVRVRQPQAGAKPFLKGYIAAKYGAPVVADPDDGDALFYLGDDYPYFIESLADVHLERCANKLKETFGGPEWLMAKQIMAQVWRRSTPDRSCADFKLMIDSLTE